MCCEGLIHSAQAEAGCGVRGLDSGTLSRLSTNGYFFFLVFLRLYSLFYYITRYRANTLIYGLFRTPFVINSRSRNHSRKVTQNCYHHMNMNMNMNMNMTCIA